MKILISGGAGFIGSAIVRRFQGDDIHLVVLDKLTYAADLTRLEGCKYTLVKQDITQELNVDDDFDWILHLAAETHVDNSINDPLRFVKTNVLGTANMLEVARKQKNLKGFLYFSTDEVFGPAPQGVLYKEWDRYNSGNPYAATKAGGEELVLAYGNTYKLPVVITHTMNAFGPTQHIEKYIPSTIHKVRSSEKVIIHGTPDKLRSGSRFYIHIDDIAEGVEFVMNHCAFGEKYNIVGREEVTNLQVAQTVAELLDKPLNYEIVDFHSSRPGHDLRYGLDGTKLKELGWQPSKTLKEGLAEII